MSHNVKNNIELLKALHKVNSSQRVNILKNADVKLINAICECALNTLKGTVPLDSYQKKNLSRYKKLLRALIQRKSSWKRKRTQLVQTGKGAFLPILIGAALNTLFNYFTSR